MRQSLHASSCCSLSWNISMPTSHTHTHELTISFFVSLSYPSYTSYHTAEGNSIHTILERVGFEWIKLQFKLGFPGGSAGKESVYNARDWGSILGLGRCPGEGKGYPLQYSVLENPLDCIPHGSQRDTTERFSLHNSNYSSAMYWVDEDKSLRFLSYKSGGAGISVVVQWLRFRAPKAGGPGFDPWSGN